MELATRNQIAEEFTWNLKDMYENDELWEQDIETVINELEELAKYEGVVCENASNLLNTLELSAKLSEKFMYAFSYAARLFDEDQGNTAHQSMSQRMYALYANIAAGTAFIDPEILACDTKKLEDFFVERPELELYRLQIKETVRLKEHTLSSELEKVVAMTSEMSSTPDDVYSAFTNVDMVFPTIIDEAGEEVRITQGRFIRLLESSDRRVRKETFEKFYSVFKQNLNTLAAVYNGEVKQHIFHSKVRGYASNLEAAVDANNVSPEVYQNLIDAVHENMDKFHRYVALRKKCLGLEEMHMYDIYTPMILGVAKKISYDEAKETCLAALAILGDDYVSIAREAFENRWIDVYENQGKRTGAYSSTAYGCHPYMLLNYNDSLDDMFTVIHEMGHSIHSYYSNQAQPYIYSDYKIFVAEVASTCNEILLLEYLLKNCTDKKERAYLLNHYLDSFKGTVYRQTQFAEFEKLTNEMVEAGEGLNADNLSELYKKINEEYYGKDIVSDEEIAYEWARIPHFYYNFYVYQYATSFCAACAIAERIINEGEKAISDYKKFLSSGCTDSPVELLKIAGVDLTTKEPINTALQKFEELIRELEELKNGD